MATLEQFVVPASLDHDRVDRAVANALHLRHFLEAIRMRGVSRQSACQRNDDENQPAQGLDIFRCVHFFFLYVHIAAWRRRIVANVKPIPLWHFSKAIRY